MSLGNILLRLVADGLVLPIMLTGGVVMLRIVKLHRYQLIVRGVVTGLLALFFASIASLLYQDGQRPFEQLGVDAGAAYLNNPGFPSDHALLVFTVTFVVWASTKNKRLGLVLLALSIMVAAGRVIALVHTPADVVGGFVCAMLAAVCMYGRDFFVVSKKS